MKSTLESKAAARVRLYLTFIRSNSPYKTLRSVIDVFWGILTMCAFVFLLGAVAFYFNTKDRTGDADLLSLVAEVVSGVGSIILIMAARQAALVLIDIADTLLREHSKDWTNSQGA